MRKNLLAMCALAALAGNAVAMQAAPTGGNGTQIITGTAGHSMVVPYFTAQGDNATLISVTNLDPTNGKVVKVRFRGAANSDDVLDFTLYMSPADMWTASISKNAAGVAVLKTTDTSCTQPFNVGRSTDGQAFLTSRTDSALASGTVRNAQTLEGYVEFITMANIEPTIGAGGSGAPAAGATNPLFTATKHVSGTPPCTAAAFTALQANPATNAAAIDVGLQLPTAGITGNYVIINTKNTTAWSGAATHFLARTAAGVNATGNLIFWPQLGTTVEAGFRAGTLAAPGLMGIVTADPALLQGAPAGAAATTLTPLWLDLPDLSTPIGNAPTATDQAREISALLAGSRARNEFVTNDSLAAETDWLFSMPTRRFATVFNYAQGVMVQNVGNNQYFNSTATTTVATNGAALAGTNNTGLTTSGNDTLGRRICVTGLAQLGISTVFDREETTPTAAAGVVVVSPADPAAAPGTVSLCGEAALVSFNNPSGASALLGTISRVDMTVPYQDGWASFGTPAAAAPTVPAHILPLPAAAVNGLPYIGASFTRLVNGTTNFGIAYPVRKAQ
jgi:hypothetical protein